MPNVSSPARPPVPRACARLWLLALGLAALGGCSWEWAHRIYPLPFYDTGVTVQGAPERIGATADSIAVLPFTFEQKDNAERREAVALLRETVHRALDRLRSFEVMPLAVVDRHLDAAGIGRPSLALLPPQALRSVTGAQRVLYGHVKRTRNLTLFIYSHTVYEGTFRLMDASTGELLWSGRLWEGRRGGLFVDLLVLDMFLTEPKNRKLPDAYARAADRMVSKLVATLPEPLTPTGLAPEIR
jgi:TolB-like protein